MRIGDANLQAMQALETAMQATANNLANVNTEEFNAQRVTLETGPEGLGVAVGDVVEISSQGPLIQTQDLSNAGEQIVLSQTTVEGSNTDLVREVADLVSTEHAYAANAVVIRTADDMQGALLDMVV